APVWTGLHVSSADEQGASIAFNCGGVAGSPPSHAVQLSRARTTGMRSCSSAHSSFDLVVTIAKLRTHSPAGERQFSHKPASAIRHRSASAIAYGCFPVAVFFHS